MMLQAGYAGVAVKRSAPEVPSMTRLRVYLAGPIRGCNDEQRTWWRNEVKTTKRC